MIKHFTTLLIKIIVISLVSMILLPLFSRMNITQALITAIILSFFSYVFGDLWILPRYGNITATIIDAVVAAVIIDIMDWSFKGVMTLSLGGLILTVGIITVGEWFFHKYLREKTPIT